jgi:hypothetical protein
VTRQEALILLNAEEDNFKDVVLSSIFEHKQFLLKSVITPQVFKTRARKLSVINEAYKFLLDYPIEEIQSKTNFDNIKIENLKINSLLSFYRNYENTMSQLKLKFMQNHDPAFVSHSCTELSELEHQKLISISIATISISINSLIEIKISEFVNSGEIIKELKRSTDKEITKENIIFYPTLIKDISRSRKYANFTTQKNLKDA